MLLWFFTCYGISFSAATLNQQLQENFGVHETSSNLMFECCRACAAVSSIIPIFILRKKFMTRLQLTHISIAVCAFGFLLRPGILWFGQEPDLNVVIASLIIDGLAIGPIITLNMPELVDSLE